LLDSGAFHVTLPPRHSDAGLPSSQSGGQLQGEAHLKTEVTNMASKELELTSTTYLMAAIGAVIIGGLAAMALGGVANTIAAAAVGGLAGGCLGLFF
jgi:hypothetical protein